MTQIDGVDDDDEGRKTLHVIFSEEEEDYDEEKGQSVYIWLTIRKIFGWKKGVWWNMESKLFE